MDLAKNKKVQAALRCVRATDEQTVADMLSTVVIPAPPFGEAARGGWVADQLRSLGLTVSTDEVGNVIAHDGPLPASAAVIISAHLDTIFPAETSIEVKRSAARISAPGIADNCRGLAALLAVARAIRQAGIATEQPLL